MIDLQSHLEIWRQQNNQTLWPGKKFPKLTVESDWYNLDTSCNYVSYGRIMNETAIWNQKFRMNLYQYDWISIACVSETILYKNKIMGGKSTKLTPEELSDLVANQNIRCKITVSLIMSSAYNFKLMRVKSRNSGMDGSMTLGNIACQRKRTERKRKDCQSQHL